LKSLAQLVVLIGLQLAIIALWLIVLRPVDQQLPGRTEPDLIPVAEVDQPIPVVVPAAVAGPATVFAAEELAVEDPPEKWAGETALPVPPTQATYPSQRHAARKQCSTRRHLPQFILRRNR
jgi:hypothetical protein